MAAKYNEFMASDLMQEKREYLFFESSTQAWTRQECKLFLRGLLQFWGSRSRPALTQDETIKNQKIARVMGNPKMANHVKFVRPVYLRRIRKLAKEQKLKPRQIAERDLENFDNELYSFFLNVKNSK